MLVAKNKKIRIMCEKLQKCKQVNYIRVARLRFKGMTVANCVKCAAFNVGRTLASIQSPARCLAPEMLHAIGWLNCLAHGVRSAVPRQG